MKFDKNELWLIKDYLEQLKEEYVLDAEDIMEKAIAVIDKLIKEGE